MRQGQDIPDIVDFAYQIIALHRENETLRRKLAHSEELVDMYSKSTKDSIEHGNKMVGLILTAALDPGSVISKGHAELLGEEYATYPGSDMHDGQ
jgi:hypothetical protein